MTLSTHIVAGTALSYTFTGNPVASFGIGLLSHYLLDSISHWDYPISFLGTDAVTPRKKKIALLLFDVLKVLMDVALGIGILVFALSLSKVLSDPVIIAGIIGSAFPDFLQFALLVTKNKIFDILQKFHHAFHSASSLNDMPIRGIISQILIVIFFVSAIM